MKSIRPARCVLIAALCVLHACAGDSGSRIIVLDRSYPTAAPVLTWKDEGGYDGHLPHCFFTPERELPSRPAPGCNTPLRYSERGVSGLPDRIREAIGNGGYDIDLLVQRVDQVVLHYDVCGTSRQCFRVLHDIRGLSCHFLLDLDGTVYQTLDLVHRGRHATKANDRSIGIEIAHMGAYSDPGELTRWYSQDVDGGRVFHPPLPSGDADIRLQGFVARPARPGIFEGTVNGNRLYQYDFTEEQYTSLIHLLRALREVFPRIAARVPTDAAGDFSFEKMEDDAFEAFSGVLGHYHVQKNKSDPGPATDWARILSGLVDS